MCKTRNEDGQPFFANSLFFCLTIHMYAVGDRSDQDWAHKYSKQSKGVEEEEG